MDNGREAGREDDVVACFDARVVLSRDAQGRYSATILQSLAGDGTDVGSTPSRVLTEVEASVLRAVDAAEAPAEWIAEDLALPRGKVAVALDALVDMGVVARRAYRGAGRGCATLRGRTLHRLTSAGRAALVGLPGRETPTPRAMAIDSPSHETPPPDGAPPVTSPATGKWTSFHDGVLSAVRTLEGKETVLARSVLKAMRLECMPNKASQLTKVNATLKDLYLAGRVRRERVMVKGRHALCPAYAYGIAEPRSVETPSVVDPFPAPEPTRDAAASYPEDRGSTEASTPSAVALPVIVARPCPPARSDARRPHAVAVDPVDPRVDVAPRAAPRLPRMDEATPRSRAEVAAAILSAGVARPTFKVPRLSALERIEREVDPFAHLRDPVGAGATRDRKPTVEGRAASSVGTPPAVEILASMAGMAGDKGWLSVREVAAATPPYTATAVEAALRDMHAEGLVWMRRDHDAPGSDSFKFSLKRQPGRGPASEVHMGP